MRPYGLKQLERDIAPLKIRTFTCDRCGNLQHVAQHPDQKTLACFACGAVQTSKEIKHGIRH